MAKVSKRLKRMRGPQLAAAFFCETLLEDKDGVLSAIRIIDTVTVQIPNSAPPNIPSDEHRIPVVASGLITFKTGDSPGEHKVRIVAESPSGKKQTVKEDTVVFTKAEQGGINIRLNSVVQVKKGGLFWFHVFLDEKRFTSMPLIISVERVDSSQEKPSDGRQLD
jgi:hypothetical protein